MVGRLIWGHLLFSSMLSIAETYQTLRRNRVCLLGNAFAPSGYLIGDP